MNDGLHLLKVQAANRITQAFKESGMVQIEFAKILKVHQSKVSLIKNGRLKEFTLEFLLRCLDRMGTEYRLDFTRGEG